MKTLKKISMMAVAAAVAVVGFAGSANAQPMDQRMGQPMREVKTVHVVETVRHVPVAKRGGLFDRLDINNNGMVSKWEFKQRYGDSRQAMRTFSRADTNHDGRLSHNEVRAARSILRA